jgi:hypothetical protein
MHLGFLVSTAYSIVIVTYELVGFYTIKSDDRRKTHCGSFVSERNLNNKDANQTNPCCYTEEVASDCKVEPKKFWLNIIRRFTRINNPAKEMLYLDNYVTAEICSKVITLIAATKINWFQTNHHTGQGGATHFTSKALQTIGQEFSDGGNITDLTSVGKKQPSVFLFFFVFLFFWGGFGFLDFFLYICPEESF